MKPPQTRSTNTAYMTTDEDNDVNTCDRLVIADDEVLE